MRYLGGGLRALAAAWRRRDCRVASALHAFDVAVGMAEMVVAPVRPTRLEEWLYYPNDVSDALSAEDAKYAHVCAFRDRLFVIGAANAQYRAKRDGKLPSVPVVEVEDVEDDEGAVPDVSDTTLVEIDGRTVCGLCGVMLQAARSHRCNGIAKMKNHMSEIRRVRFDEFVAMYVRLVPKAQVCGHCAGCAKVVSNEVLKDAVLGAQVEPAGVLTDAGAARNRSDVEPSPPRPPAHARVMALLSPEPETLGDILMDDGLGPVEGPPSLRVGEAIPRRYADVSPILSHESIEQDGEPAGRVRRVLEDGDVVHMSSSPIDIMGVVSAMMTSPLDVSVALPIALSLRRVLGDSAFRACVGVRILDVMGASFRGMGAWCHQLVEQVLGGLCKSLEQYVEILSTGGGKMTVLEAFQFFLNDWRSFVDTLEFGRGDTVFKVSSDMLPEINSRLSGGSPKKKMEAILASAFVAVMAQNGDGCLKAVGELQDLVGKEGRHGQLTGKFSPLNSIVRNGQWSSAIGDTVVRVYYSVFGGRSGGASVQRVEVDLSAHGFDSKIAVRAAEYRCGTRIHVGQQDGLSCVNLAMAMLVPCNKACLAVYCTPRLMKRFFVEHMRIVLDANGAVLRQGSEAVMSGIIAAIMPGQTLTDLAAVERVVRGVGRDVLPGMLVPGSAMPVPLDLTRSEVLDVSLDEVLSKCAGKNGIDWNGEIMSENKTSVLIIRSGHGFAVTRDSGLEGQWWVHDSARFGGVHLLRGAELAALGVTHHASLLWFPSGTRWKSLSVLATQYNNLTGLMLPVIGAEGLLDPSVHPIADGGEVAAGGRQAFAPPVARPVRSVLTVGDGTRHGGGGIASVVGRGRDQPLDDEGRRGPGQRRAARGSARCTLCKSTKEQCWHCWRSNCREFLWNCQCSWRRAVKVFNRLVDRRKCLPPESLGFRSLSGRGRAAEQSKKRTAVARSIGRNVLTVTVSSHDRVVREGMPSARCLVADAERAGREQVAALSGAVVASADGPSAAMRDVAPAAVQGVATATPLTAPVTDGAHAQQEDRVNAGRGRAPDGLVVSLDAAGGGSRHESTRVMGSAGARREQGMNYAEPLADMVASMRRTEAAVEELARVVSVLMGGQQPVSPLFASGRGAPYPVPGVVPRPPYGAVPLPSGALCGPFLQLPPPGVPGYPGPQWPRHPFTVAA